MQVPTFHLSPAFRSPRDLTWRVYQDGRLLGYLDDGDYALHCADARQQTPVLLVKQLGILAQAYALIACGAAVVSLPLGVLMGIPTLTAAILTFCCTAFIGPIFFSRSLGIRDAWMDHVENRIRRQLGSSSRSELKLELDLRC